VAVRRDLTRALAAMPRAQRVVLVPLFCEDLTVKQTAELPDCSPGTIKNRTSRALDQLRQSAALTAHTEGSSR
jgi:RNA polymerase sigma factor (sigma-70 family)